MTIVKLLLRHLWPFATYWCGCLNFANSTCSSMTLKIIGTQGWSFDVETLKHRQKETQKQTDINISNNTKKINTQTEASHPDLFFPMFYTKIFSTFSHVITPHFLPICCTCYMENNLKFLQIKPSPLLKILATALIRPC